VPRRVPLALSPSSGSRVPGLMAPLKCIRASAFIVWQGLLEQGAISTGTLVALQGDIANGALLCEPA
jgi:hypothetical protein